MIGELTVHSHATLHAQKQSAKLPDTVIQLFFCLFGWRDCFQPDRIRKTASYEQARESVFKFYPTVNLNTVIKIWYNYLL